MMQNEKKKTTLVFKEAKTLRNIETELIENKEVKWRNF